MVQFGEFLKTWSLRSNSVTRQVSFNRSKIGEKCQISKSQMRHFEKFSNIVLFTCNDFSAKIFLLFSIFDQFLIRSSLRHETNWGFGRFGRFNWPTWPHTSFSFYRFCFGLLYNKTIKKFLDTKIGAKIFVQNTKLKKIHEFEFWRQKNLKIMLFFFAFSHFRTLG